MKLKNLFVIPEGQKISEKGLYRVLIANVCSILLCMACLAGSTWAWFTVSVKSTDNVIQMGRPEIKIYTGATEISSGATLQGNNDLMLQHGNSMDSLDNRHDLYVTFTVNYAEDRYEIYTIRLPGEKTDLMLLQLISDTSYTLNWSVSWFAPANTTLLEEMVIRVPATDASKEEVEEITTDTPTDPATDTPSDPSADTPSAPSADTPSDPSADTPSAPATETPSDPVTETSADSATDSPATE